MVVQEAAEVDLEHHVKLSEQAADTAYTPFERQLAQLEALSQVAPLCTAQFAQLYRCAFAGKLMNMAQACYMSELFSAASSASSGVLARNDLL